MTVHLARTILVRLVRTRHRTGALADHRPCVGPDRMRCRLMTYRAPETPRPLVFIENKGSSSDIHRCTVMVRCASRFVFLARVPCRHRGPLIPGSGSRTETPAIRDSA